MNLHWNLDDLFKNSQDFYKEMKKIDGMLARIQKYNNIKLNEHSLFHLLNQQWQIKELTNKILVYGSLMYYKNVNSKGCIKLKSDAEFFNNGVNSKLSFVDRKIIHLGKKVVNKYMIKNNKLEIYKLYIDNLFRMQKHISDDVKKEKINSNIDNINLQLNLYNDLLKNINYGEIEINDKKEKISVTNYAKYVTAKNRGVRKKVYLTVNNNFKSFEDNFANILNLIFGYRIENSKLEKYNSVLEKTLFEENINPKIIDVLIKCVNNNLSLIQQYIQTKSKFLGINKPHLYDLGVSLDSNLDIKYSIEDAIRIIKNALKPLGKEYLNTVNHLLDGYIDATPNNNKHQSIVFSWQSYSFMNFRGTYIDLKNMIHEIGHIVNYYLSKENLPFIYEDSTVFVGETASIVNEILLNRYLYEHAKTKKARIFYLSKEIENYFTSVFKQTMYTELENELYEFKLTNELNSNLLSEKYCNLIRKYYGDNIIIDDISSIEWTRLGHLYRWSYYHYKYATGLIIASAVVNCLINEHTLSNEEYLKFLSSGSSLYSLDLLKILGIDLTNTSIIENGFKILKKDIEELNNIINQDI